MAAEDEVEWLEQVDEWVVAQGLAVDTVAAGPQSIAGLVEANRAELDKVAARQMDAGWRKRLDRGERYAYSRRFQGNPTNTSLTVGPLDTDLDGFGVFANHDQMGNVAKLWDNTFGDIAFEGTLTRAGAGEPSSANTARIVRWHFFAAPLSKRELFYAVVPVPHKDGVLFTYVSLKGKPVSKGWTRARLLSPCFDAATPRPSGSGLVFHHMITVQLQGSIPLWLHRNLIDPAFIKQTHKEFVRIQDLVASDDFVALCRI